MTPRILIVEDEAIVAQDISSLLRKLEYTVVGTAFSGEDALAMASVTLPDLALMDIKLRGSLDGIDTACALREQFDIPVIFLTAFADGSTLRRARLAQPLGYLLKPFQITELHSMIEMALYKHQMEQHLKQSEARFRILAEVNPALIAVIRQKQDGSGWQFVYANPAAQSIVGYSADELSNMDHLDLILPERRKHFAKQLEITWIGNKSIRTETPILVKDGRTLWLECVLEQIVYDAEPAVLVTALDTTERKQIQQQRMEMEVEREKHKMFSHFVNELAHDFRTPLAVLKTHLYLVKKVPDEQKKGHLVGVMQNQVTHLERLLDDMLSMADLDTNRTLRPEIVCLNELLQRIARSYQTALEDKQLSLSLECDESLPRIMAEAKSLYRAVMNLLTNAYHYTPSGGRIMIRCYQTNDHIIIEVADTGIGIGPADLPHIFERFYRADTARSTDSGGTGLGLTISDKIVQMHGGHIEVESMVGEGAVFRIFLPNMPAAQPLDTVLPIPEERCHSQNIANHTQ
jgi:PAS domain S-box-containing protein